MDCLRHSLMKAEDDCKLERKHTLKLRHAIAQRPSHEAVWEIQREKDLLLAKNKELESTLQVGPPAAEPCPASLQSLVLGAFPSHHAPKQRCPDAGWCSGRVAPVPDSEAQGPAGFLLLVLEEEGGLPPGGLEESPRLPMRPPGWRWRHWSWRQGGRGSRAAHGQGSLSPHPTFFPTPKVTQQGSSSEQDSVSTQALEAERTRMLGEHQELVNAIYDVRQALRGAEDVQDKVRGGARRGLGKGPNPGLGGGTLLHRRRSGRGEKSSAPQWGLGALGQDGP